jgi:hypothetical protein
MPASNKKVTRRAASLERGIAKNVAKNVAKRAAKAAKAPSLKAVAKATTKVLDKPKAKRAPVTALGAIRQEIAAKADAKARKAPVRMVSGGESVVGGAKGKIIAMIAAEGGASAAEVCKALGWVRAGATIGRAIKLAGFKVAKVRDADGVLRYSRAN